MQKILKSKILSKFINIHHGTSTKAFGQFSFKYIKDSNEIIIDHAKFLKELNLPLTHAVFLCNQNHTDKIAIIEKPFNPLNNIKNTDAMITNHKNVTLLVYTADCMPVLIFDPVQEVIAAIHSGWKGTIKKIVIKTLKKMQKKFGSKKQNCRVYIGPSIGHCCYSVRNTEQIEMFKKNYNNLKIKKEQIYVDLWDSLKQDLLNFGILPGNIENSNKCTVCKNKFFASHRSEKQRTTANLSVISMIENKKIRE